MSGFPETRADLPGSPWKFPASLELLINLWIAVKFHSEGSRRGSRQGSSGKFGELPGKSGDFPEARGSLTPPQGLAKSISKSLP